MSYVLRVYNLRLSGPHANPDQVQFSTLPNIHFSTLPISVRNVLSRNPLRVQVTAEAGSVLAPHNHAGTVTVILEDIRAKCLAVLPYE